MKMRLMPTVLAALTLMASAVSAAPTVPETDAPYAYGGLEFTGLVADSYRQIHASDPQTFYTWMDKDCQHIALGKAGADKPMPGWNAVLQQKKKALDRAATPALKAQQEMQIAAWLHKTLKAGLPHFSLDEGFEFTNAVRKGERQCVLQATLLAGMLQATGVDAGLVMVYKNIAGQSSNNGHAVTLMKRADGKDILVDCSDPTPFVKHQGLFVADSHTGQYRYVEPVYAEDSAVILGYTPDGTTHKVADADIQPLDYDFVRSQIEYYRGERTPGGLLSPDPTPTGLTSEAKHLRASVAYCPQNPLAQYMLGRVYMKQSRLSTARRQLAVAYGLYARQGHVPQGCRDAMAQAKMAQPRVSQAKL